MKTQDQVWAALIESNPVPDVDVFGRENMEDTTHLATLQKGSSEMTQLSTKDEEKEQRSRSMAWLAAAVLVVLVGVAVFLLNQGDEEAPTATDPPPTTLAQSSTTVIESSLSDIPVWIGQGNGQWTPARSKIPYAFTNAEGWNSIHTSSTEERFSLCPGSPEGGSASMCNLASVSVHFLDYETVDETREFLASFEGAELGDEQPIAIDSAPGIRFEFTHDIPPHIGQFQGGLEVPAAVDMGNDMTPLGEGPFGRSIVSIVDVDGVIVTLVFQGTEVSRGAPTDGFATYKEDGLGIIDSIIWGNP